MQEKYKNKVRTYFLVTLYKEKFNTKVVQKYMSHNFFRHYNFRHANFRHNNFRHVIFATFVSINILISD